MGLSFLESKMNLVVVHNITKTYGFQYILKQGSIQKVLSEGVVRHTRPLYFKYFRKLPNYQISLRKKARITLGTVICLFYNFELNFKSKAKSKAEILNRDLRK